MACVHPHHQLVSTVARMSIVFMKMEDTDMSIVLVFGEMKKVTILPLCLVQVFNCRRTVGEDIPLSHKPLLRSFEGELELEVVMRIEACS